MTAVPPIVVSATGILAPAEADILAGRLADLNAAFGGGMNPSLSTPQGQLASTDAAIIGDANDQFLEILNGFDPAYASGRQQDALGRIYFISRLPAEPTVTQVTCIGLAGVVIPVGQPLQAADGNLYLCQQSGAIPTTGSVVLPFACATSGPIACPAQTFVIYRQLAGFDQAISTTAGAVGTLVESRAAFEARRQASVAINALGTLPAIEAALLNVPGVIDAMVIDNPQTSAQTINGVSVAANSLYASVLGGAAQAVGNALWSKKPPGCGYNGNTTVTVVDSGSGYTPPLPSYQVTFETPASTPVNFVVTILNNPGVPQNAAALVTAALQAAFAGTDGGARARIASTLYAGRYYPGIVALGPWAEVVSIDLGTGANPTGTSVVLTMAQAPVLGAVTLTLQ